MSKYLLSFTAASLLPLKTKEIASLYLKNKDWSKVRETVVKNNILQINSESSRKRVFLELKRRILNLNSEQLFFLSNALAEDLKHITFLACLKTYRIIYEFCIEILYNKILYQDYSIMESDYSHFIESKKLNYQNLSKISENTNYKIKQVFFKILAEAGLLEQNNRKKIIIPVLSNDFKQIVINDNPKYLKAFLQK